MKKSFKYGLWAILLITTVVLTVWYMLLPKEVHTENIFYKDLSESFMEQGKYEPKDTYILNSQSRGEVTEINVYVGQEVYTGEELVVIAPEDVLNTIKELEYKKNGVKANEENANVQTLMQIKNLETQLATLENEFERLFGENSIALSKIAAAKSNYEFVEQKYKEGVELSKIGAMSQSDLAELKKNMDDSYTIYVDSQKEISESNKKYYENRIGKYKEQIATLKNDDSYKKISKASIDEINSSIETIKDKLSKNTIKAPFDGMVKEIVVKKGAFIVENSPAIVLYDKNSMRIKTYLLAEDAIKIKVGHKVNCKLTEGIEFEGEVGFISPSASETVSSIGLVENRCLVEVVSNNIPEGIGDGFGIDITFSIALATNVTTAPISALVPFESGSAVYVVKNNKAVLTKVKTGLRASGDIEVLSGIVEGDIIITDPIGEKVKDNISVKIVVEGE